MRHFSSLKIRLLAGSSVFLVLLLGAYASYAIWHHEYHLMTQVRESADRISEFIKSSTHYSMLLNRKEDVYAAMETMGTQAGVEGLRIYNKRGVITFSTNKEEQGQSADLKAEACIACHAADEPLSSLPSSNRIRIYTGPKGRILGLINPIRNEASCAAPECHEPPSEKTILGVLDVRMSLSRIDEEMATERMLLVLYAILVVVVMIALAWWFLRKTVLTPVDALMEGTRQLSAGNLDHLVDIDSPTELGELAESFNSMTGAIRSAQEKVQEWSETLEKRVEEKSQELTAIHDSIAQVEKMASLGRLSATVAHELNNPLEAILTYAKLLRRQLIKKEALPGSAEWVEELDIIIRETQRCGDIVKNLLLFSKKESGEFVFETVDAVLERAYRLMKHHLEMRNIRYEQHLPKDPTHMLCDPQQVQQALVALYVNAADAMADGGTLWVTASTDPGQGHVVLAVADSGAGIREEDLPHVFEPFFTTKVARQGVGLGLSVVYGIMQRHSGTVTVESQPGAGTTFRLSFPMAHGESHRNEIGEREKEAGAP